MATKQLEVRTVIAQRDDIGAVDSKDFDETTTLASFLDVTPGRRITLAAAASDTAITFTNAAFFFIRSHTNSFKLRLAAGETLMSNLIQFGPIVSNVATNSSLATSVLLSGNGSTTADLEVWIVEKYTA